MLVVAGWYTRITIALSKHAHLDRTLNQAAVLVFRRQVSKDRRRFLHRHIDMLNNQGLGYQLSHGSRGAGRHRVLIVKKIQMAATQPMPMDLGPNFVLPSGTSSAACGAGPGHKLGGRQSTSGKREASAMAAELRMSAASNRGLKKPRLSQSPAPLSQQSSAEGKTAAEQDDTSSSSDSSDSENACDSGAEGLDEEMRRVMEISLQDANKAIPKGSQDQEDRELQEAVRLSLESASSQDVDLPATPSPARFARLSASRSALVAMKYSYQPPTPRSRGRLLRGARFRNGQIVRR